MKKKNIIIISIASIIVVALVVIILISNQIKTLECTMSEDNQFKNDTVVTMKYKFGKFDTFDSVITVDVGEKFKNNMSDFEEYFKEDSDKFEKKGISWKVSTEGTKVIVKLHGDKESDHEGMDTLEEAKEYYEGKGYSCK